MRSAALVPQVGSIWVWELDKPHARELVTVVGTFWNGEEYWVGTEPLSEMTAELIAAGDRTIDVDTAWNELDRFLEAATLVRQ